MRLKINLAYLVGTLGHPVPEDADKRFGIPDRDPECHNENLSTYGLRLNPRIGIRIHRRPNAIFKNLPHLTMVAWAVGEWVAGVTPHAKVGPNMEGTT